MDLNKDATVKQITQSTQNDPISANRLAWYVADLEGANWAGVSPLRACYPANLPLWQLPVASQHRVPRRITSYMR